MTKRVSGGYQSHHYKSLDGAQVHLVNAVQYLAGVTETTGDPLHAELEAIARDLCLRVGVAHRKALADWEHLQKSDPATFYAALRGHIRWPDEPAGDFEAAYYCNNQCIFHTHQAPWATEADCNCGTICPRHGIATQPERADPLMPIVVDKVP